MQRTDNKIFNKFMVINDPQWGKISVTPIKRSEAKCKSGINKNKCFSFGDIFVAKQYKNSDKTFVIQLVAEIKQQFQNYSE